MQMSFFIGLLFALQGLYWLVGRQSAKGVKDTDDYFLAKRNVHLFPLMMTFLATQVGGGIVLGSAEEAYRFGWPALFYPLGVALGLIILGLGIGRRWAELPLSTVAEIFETVYKSCFLRKVASSLSVVSLFMILIAQVLASSKFLASMGLTNIYLFILFWAVVIFYTATGGLKAVIATDMVQAGVFSLVFLGCFGLIALGEPLALTWPQGELPAVSGKLFGWLVMPILFMVIEQDMGQRCFAGATPRTVSWASLLAGLATFIVCVIPIFLGCLANTMGLQVPAGESVLMTVIAKTTNPWVAALVGCAVLAAIISTATSLINAISSNLASDFALRGGIKTAQGVTTLISVAAIGCAFYCTNIVDLLIQSYELSVSCLFVPIVLALFKRGGGCRISAFFSILFGAVAFFIYPVIALPLSALGYGTGKSILWYYGRNNNKRIINGILSKIPRNSVYDRARKTEVPVSESIP